MGRKPKVATYKPTFNLQMDEHLKAEVLPRLAEHFGMSQTEMIVHAIKELDRRKDEPPQEHLLNLARFGVHDAVLDFAKHDLTDYLRHSENISIYTDDLSLVLRDNLHSSLLKMRLRPPVPGYPQKKTLIILPAGGRRFKDNVMLVENFLRTMSDEEASQVRQQSGEPGANFRVIGTRADYNIFNVTMFVSDTIAISTLSFPMPIYPRLAMIYKSTSSPVPHQFDVRHVEGDSDLDVQTKAPSSDFFRQCEAWLHHLANYPLHLQMRRGDGPTKGS